MGDRNYGRAKAWHQFRQDSGGQADLIVRMKWNSFAFSRKDGAAFDLIQHLQALPNDHLPHEVNLQAKVRRGVTTPVRLIILRKPPEAAEATRDKLRKQASRKQKTLDPRSLIAAEFLILGTTLPAEGYPAEQVLAAYRLRWQIELAFKRLKTLLHIDKLPAHTEAGARSWLYPHLILALLCDDLSQDFLDLFPEDLLDAAYLPSLWTAQKLALRALVDAIRGSITIEALMGARREVHKALANAPRQRKPHVRYPRGALF